MTSSHDQLVHSLEARYYTSPKIYKAEQQGLLARTWQFAGHVSQLATPGAYFTFQIAGENLFCIRDKQQNIRAYYNVCQHRAHELLKGSGTTKVITCPYHAWTYELTGEMRSGPNVDSMPSFDRSKICLTDIKVEEFHGFIFVNLDSQAAPMDDWFPNARAELKSYVPDISRLKPIAWIDIPERCNWKVSVENYSECYHCARCHPTFSNGVIAPSTYDIQPQGYCLRHTTECQNIEKMSYPIDLTANEHAGKYSSWFLWPMFSFQVYPGNILNTYHWRAIDHEHVIVWRGWYTIDGKSSDLISQLAQQDRETTVKEDIHLVESVQRGLQSKGYTPGPLVIDPDHGINSEHSIKALQQWMREAIDHDLKDTDHGS